MAKKTYNLENKEQNFDVIYYETIDGKSPVYDFMYSLPTKESAKMYQVIALLEEEGCELRMPYSKHLSDGIFELRAKVGIGALRVLYFFFFERKIILTNGFVKKSRKTPKRELEKAYKYRNDYVARQKEEKKDVEL